MVFVLVNDAGTEIARATARVSCGATPDILEPALSTGLWFPLQIGNEWIYRVNTRSDTSSYVTWKLTRTELIGDRTYFVLSTGPSDEMRIRSDADGRLYRLTDANTGAEELWLDPTIAASVWWHELRT
jgi:hypothetical protein